MGTSIEAPLAFLQKPVEIVLFNVVEYTHVALGLVPEVLDAVDVISPVGKQLGMVDA